MRDRETRAFINGGVVVALAIGVGMFWYAQTGRAQSEDGPGPNLVIEVGGEAKGRVVIDLDPMIAPKHTAQILSIAKEGGYDGVAFHRVIEGFMAQTGDVQFGKPGGDPGLVGTGKSTYANIPAEFSDTPFLRGTVGMARSNDPDSANSQFFIMFAPGDFLNGNYTVIGRVVEGMEIVDAIKRGDPDLNGVVAGEPDRMVKVTVE
jgi:peptidylprolyl isomerase